MTDSDREKRIDVTNEMVIQAHRRYFDDPAGPSRVEAACMRASLEAAFASVEVVPLERAQELERERDELRRELQGIAARRDAVRAALRDCPSFLPPDREE